MFVIQSVIACSASLSPCFSSSFPLPLSLPISLYFVSFCLSVLSVYVCLLAWLFARLSLYIYISVLSRSVSLIRSVSISLSLSLSLCLTLFGSLCCLSHSICLILFVSLCSGRLTRGVNGRGGYSHLLASCTVSRHSQTGNHAVTQTQYKTPCCCRNCARQSLASTVSARAVGAKSYLHPGHHANGITLCLLTLCLNLPNLSVSLFLSPYVCYSISSACLTLYLSFCLSARTYLYCGVLVFVPVSSVSQRLVPVFLSLSLSLSF